VSKDDTNRQIERRCPGASKLNAALREVNLRLMPGGGLEAHLEASLARGRTSRNRSPSAVRPALQLIARTSRSRRSTLMHYRDNSGSCLAHGNSCGGDDGSPDVVQTKSRICDMARLTTFTMVNTIHSENSHFLPFSISNTDSNRPSSSALRKSLTRSVTISPEIGPRSSSSNVSVMNSDSGIICSSTD
jgi:hypothetical protein